MKDWVTKGHVKMASGNTVIERPRTPLAHELKTGDIVKLKSGQTVKVKSFGTDGGITY